MDPATYATEAAVERGHWWFRGRRRILAGLLEELRLPPRARVLDVGCGTGANAPVLGAADRWAVGLDASPVPLGMRDRGHAARVRGDAGRLPFADDSFDLVVALDVLEHLDDDAAAARELARVCRPGGAVVIFVPALQILWGWQDEVSHHRRRYRAGPLRAVVEGAGLRVTHVTYFNTLLFAPILAARLALRVWRPSGARNENELGGPVANAVLGAIFAAEAPLLRRRLRLPIGVSLACVATRPRR